MRRFVKWISAPMALALVLSACDSAQQLTSPSGDIAPQFGVKSGKRELATVTVSELGGHGSAVVSNGAGGYIVVENLAGELVARLDIPAGAVQKGTTFEMTVGADYSIELTATSVNAKSFNDVGSAGFKKPVYLTFNTTFIVRDGNLGVAEIRNDALVPVPSFEDRFNGRLIGILRHFSGYGPTTDRTEPPPCEETPEGCN
jgi:hypothetical protein